MSGFEPIFECVPNFSEGRQKDVLDAIVQAAAVPRVRLLGCDPDSDHNRAVLTLMGPAEPLSQAVFNAVQKAVSLIDLRRHQGTHPRIGAADVVPFVPWENADMDQACLLARTMGDRLAHELGLPVYLYGKAAQRPDRVNLAWVRRGEFEGLADRMPKDPPDFGQANPHLTAGAVAVGARPVLIAFNVYLHTRDIMVARRVARSVRGSSGGLVGVQALGMDTKTKGRVQVSMNLVDYSRTSLPQALEMVRREAAQYGVLVAESEVVGLMPFAAVKHCMQYYLQMPGFDRGRVLETASDQSARGDPRHSPGVDSAQC